MTSRSDTGSFGEALAAQFLQRRGLRIIARNYRIGHLELDLLARDRHDLYVVEVKTIATDQFSSPLEQLTVQKQHKLRRAMLWLMQRDQAIYRGFHIACVGVDLRTTPPAMTWVPDAVTFDS